MILPRFSEENFAKNVTLADNLKAIADKCKATPSQIALAWILAESLNCACQSCFSSLDNPFDDSYSFIKTSPFLAAEAWNVSKKMQAELRSNSPLTMLRQSEP